MNDKINTLFDYIKQLCESDLDRIISFVLSIISVNQQSEEKPDCLYCKGTHTIKYGHRTRKQRFLCHDCKRTYMHSIFRGHIAEDTLVLTDRLRSYNVLETLARYTVVDIKRKKAEAYLTSIL